MKIQFLATSRLLLVLLGLAALTCWVMKPAEADPNTWAKAVVKNNWGSDIKVVSFQHRYDRDHYDSRQWDIIPNGTKTEPVKVGYWTGFGRTGYDYWFISFVADGKVWFCKENFYCFLTKKDANQTVVLTVYRDGNQGKMKVDCPKSSDCTVALNSNQAKPNSWASAVVKNDWMDRVVNVQFRHRYDNDHMNYAEWSWLDKGASSPSVPVGFWTGFGRIGTDFWWIKFDSGCFTWTCKDTFDCFLTKDDRNKTVNVRIYPDDDEGKMHIDCPASSDCTVNLTRVLRKSDVKLGGDASSLFPKERQRPVYLIAHRCNDPEDIEKALSQGANAIECDLRWDAANNYWKVDHDILADWSTKLSDWLDAAKKAADKHGDKFALIVFDIKTPEQLPNLLNTAREALPDDLNLLFSTASYEDRGCFDPILNSLRKNEGVAIDEHNNPQEVKEHFTSKGVTNFWYGNGITGLGLPLLGPNVWPSAKKAAKMRDHDQAIKKVYVWTVATDESIGEYLSIARVDGVMVNTPKLQEAKKILNAAWDARLAERADNAFQAFKGQ